MGKRANLESTTWSCRISRRRHRRRNCCKHSRAASQSLVFFFIRRRKLPSTTTQLSGWPFSSFGGVFEKVWRQAREPLSHFQGATPISIEMHLKKWQHKSCLPLSISTLTFPLIPPGMPFGATRLARCGLGKGFTVYSWRWWKWCNVNLLWGQFITRDIDGEDDDDGYAPQPGGLASYVEGKI